MSKLISHLQTQLNLPSIATSDYLIRNSYQAEGEKIHSLNLSGQQLTSFLFPPEMQELEYLDLSNNKLSEFTLPKGCGTKLKYLYLNNNPLAKIAFSEDLPALKTLHLSNNKLTNIDFAFAFPELEALYLEKNALANISERTWAGMKSLQFLELSNNKLTNVQGFQHLQALTSLFFSENNIESIAPLAALSQLNHLDARNNQIKELPFLQEAWHFEWNKDFDWTEKKVNFFGNPLISPPVEVMTQGTAKIREWFEQAKKHKLKPLNECKLIFVGDGEVGKTSLMKQLVFGTFKEGESTTHGINKIAWEKMQYEKGKWKEIQNDKGESIRINLWDFGGQHVQHYLHQFFFTQRVIYVLVLSPRNYGKASYWLELIAKLGCDSDVLIVFNYKEEKDRQAFYLGDFYQLQKQYPYLTNSFELSCSTGEGIEAFQTKLIETILAQKDLNSQYPTNWYNIKKDLETQTKEKDYIPYEAYEAICELNDYPDEAPQKDLLVTLDKIGAIVFFDQPILNKLQVLNPDWITAGAYTILTSKITKDKQGHLNQQDLKDIFQAEIEIFSDKKKTIKYKVHQFDFILTLMYQFDLCQKNPFEENAYLIPSVFEEKSREELNEYDKYKKGGKLYRFQFTSQFEMIIMQKFIARNISKCIDKDYWASGLLIKDPHSQTFALVDTTKHSQLIDFWIKGDNIRGFWEILRNDMKDICKAYHGFQPTEQVYFEKDDKSFFFSYQSMLDSLKNGVSLITYDKDSQMKDIDVLAVIDLFEDVQKTIDRMRQNELHRMVHETNERTKAIKTDLFSLKTDLLLDIGVKSEVIKQAISNSEENQIRQMQSILKDINGMNEETQTELWKGINELKDKNEQIKAFLEKVEKERIAAGVANSASLKLKMGLPFMIGEILGIGLEYEATLANGETFFKWFKKWRGVV